MATILPSGDNWQKGNENDLSIVHDCYCPNCEESEGRTTILPTKIPLFREIVVMAMFCPKCYFKSSEVNFGGEIQPKGERLLLHVTNSDDLSRQVIKSDSATLMIPQCELEIPPNTQRGTITTLEGVLKKTITALQDHQPERLRLGDLENFYRCNKVIETLESFLQDGNDVPFDIILNDPAGNSFIENPMAPLPDPQLTRETYFRTATQDMALGLQPSQAAVEAGRIDDNNPQHKNKVNVQADDHNAVIDTMTTTTPETSLGRQEVVTFPTSCPNCHLPTETDMCMTDIPHFKEVIIMSMHCESCGYRSSEIKGGGAIPKYGTKITLTLENMQDMGREILKSDTAGIEIPELELTLDEGGLNGVYTTVEGLLQKLHDRLTSANPFASGDSSSQHHLENDGQTFSQQPLHTKYKDFLHKLKDVSQGKVFPITLIVSDPLSNSFIGPIPQDAIALTLQAEKEGNTSCFQAYVDPKMIIEEYERTHEQNEVLGLNDIQTENYKSNKDNEDNNHEYHGTDQMQDLPDRLQHPSIRGPDHPHIVAKAPVKGDTTVMGPESDNFAVPAMMQRGVMATTTTTTTTTTLWKQIWKEHELQKDHFQASSQYDGSREGMVFKQGPQGLGYYKDISLLDIYNQATNNNSS